MQNRARTARMYLQSFLVFILGITGITAEDKDLWSQLADRDIADALKIKHNNGNAKNVIIFVGDGMGLSTVTASRIMEYSEAGYLSFEKFPHIGALKTYSANKIVPDSTATATALFCGVKVNQETGGVDASVHHNDCNRSLLPETHLDSIITWAQRANKSTGFVTTTRVSHATPCALYAHTPNRNWECESRIPPESSACKDIARQLIEDQPGRNINVIMGGGRQVLQSNVSSRPQDPIDTWACYRKDGRDLIKAWKDQKAALHASHQLLENNRDLANLNLTEFTLGIFANGHLNLDHARNRGPDGMPSLADMTEAAISLLQKNHRHDGFVLMVEGGLIDQSHHRGNAKKALSETSAFSTAISRAMKMVDLMNTLIIVTSDHSHPLAIAGYADRGQKITGVAQPSKLDGIPYTTLLYGAGGENNFQYQVVNDTVVRDNPATVNTDDYDYSQQAGVKTDEVPHDGTDVLVYAQGPMAHLFHAVHEQTYVAYVIAYAAKIGPYADGFVGPLQQGSSARANWQSLESHHAYLLTAAVLVHTLHAHVDGSRH